MQKAKWPALLILVAQHCLLGIAPAKLDDVDLRAWIADVLASSGDRPAQRLHKPLPWN